MAKVLIGCEFSGILREAFRVRGHDAWSCDLLPTEIPGNHYQCDIKDIIGENFDLAIFHPPCTHLACSGAKHFFKKQKEQQEALEFVKFLMDASIPRICLENPVGIISSRICKPSQIVDMWWFGESFNKRTCLWLKNLPLLKPTNIVPQGEKHITKSGKSLPKWYNLPPSKDRWKIRSRTFQGFASAMAQQFGDIL